MGKNIPERDVSQSRGSEAGAFEEAGIAKGE